LFTALLRKLAVRARLFRHVNRLAVNNSGATAVEFGLVAAPFLALLVAIFQTGIVFLAARVLDEVVAQSGRYIMTGQAQTGNMTQAGFATYVCGQTIALFTCGKFMINVQNYTDFASASTSTPSISGFNSSGQALDSSGNAISWS
jgi:Flp pilus assembly protein TadG